PGDAEQAQRKAGGTCGRVVCCSLCVLLLLLAVAVAASVSVFVLYQPRAPEFSVGGIAISQLALTPLLPPSQPVQPPLLPAAAPSSLPTLPIPGNVPPPANMSVPVNVPLLANMSLPGNMSLPSLTGPLPTNLTLNTAQLAAAVKAAATATTLPANSTHPASPAAAAAAAATSKYLSPLASSPLLTSPLLANANITIHTPSGMTLLGLLAAREAELDAELNVTVVAGNSNHVGISYEYVTITARHLGSDVGNASIPAFHQPPRSNTTVEGHVHLTRLPLHLLPPPSSSSPLSASTLSRDALSAQSTLPLQLAIEARANVDVYNIGTPYVTVSRPRSIGVAFEINPDHFVTEISPPSQHAPPASQRSQQQRHARGSMGGSEERRQQEGTGEGRMGWLSAVAIGAITPGLNVRHSVLTWHEMWIYAFSSFLPCCPRFFEIKAPSSCHSCHSSRPFSHLLPLNEPTLYYNNLFPQSLPRPQRPTLVLMNAILGGLLLSFAALLPAALHYSRPPAGDSGSSGSSSSGSGSAVEGGSSEMLLAWEVGTVSADSQARQLLAPAGSSHGAADAHNAIEALDAQEGASGLRGVHGKRQKKKHQSTKRSSKGRR
ncbi:unnamed protein product, partial [Closterium sp. NIES-64]